MNLRVRHLYRTCMHASGQTVVITDGSGSVVLLQGPLGAAGAEGRQGEKGAKVNVSTSPSFFCKRDILMLDRF